MSDACQQGIRYGSVADDADERRRGDGAGGLASSPMGTARWGSGPSTAGEEDA